MSALIVAQLLFLEADNPEKPISLYINSPGGSVTAGTYPAPRPLAPLPTLLPPCLPPKKRDIEVDL